MVLVSRLASPTLALLILAGGTCAALAACGGARGRGARAIAVEPGSAALGDLPEDAFSRSGCLSAMGAGAADPVLLATHAQGGELSSAMLDLGGLQAAGCVDRARALPIRSVESPMVTKRSASGSGPLGAP